MKLASTLIALTVGAPCLSALTPTKVSSQQKAKPSMPSPNKLFYRNRPMGDDNKFAVSQPSFSARTATATLPTPVPLAEADPSVARAYSSQHRHNKEETTRQPRTNPFMAFLTESSNAINRSMMKRLVVSQATLLALATTVALAVTTLFGNSDGGGLLSSVQWIQGPSLFETNLLSRCLLGAMTSVPMILASQCIDQAACDRDASHVHFATTNLVVSLFGRRSRQLKSAHPEGQQQERPSSQSPKTTSTIDVILSSMGLSALTSITEEIIFRGFLPCLILAVTQSPLLAWVGQALIFGLGHIHPNAQDGENRMVVATQTFNALFGYGLVYAMTGGDLLPAIVAHAIYDVHILVSRWHNVNTQMDWTEDSMQALSESDRVALLQLRQWAGPSLTPDTLGLCRRFFYAFDVDHKHALSLPNVQRAMSYAFLSDPKQPTSDQVERFFHKVIQEREQPPAPLLPRDDKKRINLPEFVRLLFSLRARALHSVGP